LPLPLLFSLPRNPRRHVLAAFVRRRKVPGSLALPRRKGNRRRPPVVFPSLDRSLASPPADRRAAGVMRLGVAPFRILFGLVWFGIAKNSEIFFSLYFRGRIFFPKFCLDIVSGAARLDFAVPAFALAWRHAVCPRFAGCSARRRSARPISISSSHYWVSPLSRLPSTKCELSPTRKNSSVAEYLVPLFSLSFKSKLIVLVRSSTRIFRCLPPCISCLGSWRPLEASPSFL
jgi:hypothetical protein